MTYPSIRIEGTILSGELLGKIDSLDVIGQRPADFGFDSQGNLKDEIVRAWTHAQNAWKMHNDRLDTPRASKSGITETRNFIEGLLGLFGYAELNQAQPELVGDKPFRLSHRLCSHGAFAVHIVGARESLDRKPEAGAGPRFSPHAHLQEYLNLTEHLYAILTNGRLLRLLRDSTRLVRLSYVEFDLDRMFGEDLFADFAILYRLLHVSRLPKAPDQSAESLLEHYHQDSLASGERIRDGLSGAVKDCILKFASGFLNHPKNDHLREIALKDGDIAPHLYQQLLRLVYRLLFLMVIEERNLVYAKGAEVRKRNLYYTHYSLARLRRIADKRHLADGRHHDCWNALLVNFRLFDETGSGRSLGIEPLGGELFDSSALGPLTAATLDNDTLLACLFNLSLFRNPETGNLMRVNYAALNVEEFGSVYQGLLEYEPQITCSGSIWNFSFAKGDERSRTGSHYTPEELVQPLLKHSLDHLIADALKKSTAAEKESALLALKVCDVACGSGHILLAAARRIGTELAVLRTGDDQPSPSAFREAVRDVIRHCIYGMDLNPLAVELCKVALWLEAHVPEWPLSFLDHRIHCGNAIVGLAHRAELQRGVPDEAFKTLAGDDKDIAAALRKQNKEERKGQTSLNFAGRVEDDIRALDDAWRTFDQMPERSAADYYTRRAEYEKFRDNIRLRNLRLLADAQVAQFYLPKTPENRGKHVTHDAFSRWMEGLNPTGPGIAAAMTVAHRKRFGHWFIEFWDVVDAGGFDLIIGNPPYLGGTKLSGSYSHAFCEWIKWEYAPAGLSDLVVYFLRRIYDLLRPGGFVAVITTNSIKDGDIRVDGLEELMNRGGNLTFAVSGMIWPGVANLYVSLFSLHKGPWENKQCVLDGRTVPFISAFFEGYADAGKPIPLSENEEMLFEGSKFQGDGFVLDLNEATGLRESNENLSDVVLPLLNGDELNNHPEQLPSRYVIYFANWTLEKANAYPAALKIVEERVKPERDVHPEPSVRERWWQFKRPTCDLYNRIRHCERCFVVSRVTKHFNLMAVPKGQIFTEALKIFTTDRWSDFAVVQSTLHEVWARKYSGALKKDLRYSPTDCFLNFAFPRGTAHETALAAIGETYHEHRRALMRDLWLGLTDLYNLFHDPDLTPLLVTESLGDRATITGDEGFTRLRQLRELHRELDQTVLTAYGWHTESDFGPPLALGHNFHAVEFLPENDRIRYTIHPDARRELLTRLLKLNHARAAQAEQVAKQAAIAAPVKKKKSKAAKPIELAPRKHSKGINFTRGAIASYAVNRLGDRWQFGRIQMEKVLYLAQQEVGINLEMEFQHGLNGPFDEEIHKLESLAAKQGWFLATPRPGDKGTSYQRGSNIDDRCGAAASILGEAKLKFDSILDWLAKMDTERVEIWATVHAVWNELLLAKQPVCDDGIIQGVYAWHPAKARFTTDRILACIGWMRKEGFVPRGVRFETREPKAAATELELGLDLFGRADVSIPTPTWMDRPLVAPRAKRVALPPERYRAALVPHFLYQAGGKLSFERFRRAYWLLTEPKLLKKFARGELGQVAQDWGKNFCDTLKKEEFLDHLKGAVKRQLHFITVHSERWLELRDVTVTDDEHVIFDARLALLVADLWPVTEPITPLTPAEEITIQELEVVLL